MVTGHNIEARKYHIAELRVFSAHDLPPVPHTALVPSSTLRATAPRLGASLGVDYWDTACDLLAHPKDCLILDVGRDAASGHAALGAGFHIAIDPDLPARNALVRLANQQDLAVFSTALKDPLFTQPHGPLFASNTIH